MSGSAGDPTVISLTEADRTASTDRVVPSVTVAKRAESPWKDTFGRSSIRVVQCLIYFLAAAVILAIVVRLQLIVVPVLFAVILSAAVSPLVAILQLRGLGAGLSAAIAMLAGLSVVAAITWVAVRGIAGEWSALMSQANDGVGELRQFLAQGPIPISEDQLNEAQQGVTEALTGDTAREYLLSSVYTTAEVLTASVLSLIVMFFLLKDGPQIWKFLTSPLPAGQDSRLKRIGERSVSVLGSYMRGTVLINFIEALAVGAALAVLGVPLAIPLAVVVFLLAFIPLVGVVLAGGLCVLVALVAQGPAAAVIIVGVIFLVNQLEGHLLNPLILGRAVSLHPLVVLVAISAGTILAGIIGALLAVPAAAIVWTFITAWNGDESNDERVEEARARARMKIAIIRHPVASRKNSAT